MDISTEEIADILGAIDKLDCSSVEVSVGDVRIVVRRKGAGDVLAGAPALPVSTGASVSAAQATPASLAPAAAAPASTASVVKAASASGAADDLAPWLVREAQGQVQILRAPMIGTFYRAKAPGEPPFVELGQAVQKGDTLGLMEVMKLFNSFLAEAPGRVGAIFVNNGEMVEFDQPVFALLND